jgi:hypothetical protein
MKTVTRWFLASECPNPTLPNGEYNDNAPVIHYLDVDLKEGGTARIEISSHEAERLELFAARDGRPTFILSRIVGGAGMKLARHFYAA